VARRLVAAGNSVTILTTNPEARQTQVEQAQGLQVIRVPAWPRNTDYYFAPAMYGIIRRGAWDIVHCQGYHTMVAPIAMLAAWRARIPYVVTFHSGGHSSWLRNAMRPLQRAALAPLLARASGLVGVSAWEADFFRTHLGLPRERFAVIPNGAYLPRAQHAAAAAEEENLIVSVGRLERYKGHHQVIGALPAVLRECPSTRLRIVGTGPYESTLRQLADDLGVGDRVTIGGITASDREGMASLLMRASLVILLSNYESQSVSAMEALALGRPVLVADNTALHELAASGLARATAAGSTPEAVAAAILGQLRQPLFPENAELPSWDTCAEEVLQLYHRTLAPLTPVPVCAS
jgi:glycosyltransferase involved in cell wall biosynthesis